MDGPSKESAKRGPGRPPVPEHIKKARRNARERTARLTKRAQRQARPIPVSPFARGYDLLDARLRTQTAPLDPGSALACITRVGRSSLSPAQWQKGNDTLRSYRDWGISGVADNTARALHTGFRHWTAFCLEYDRSILPVDPEDLMQCLSHMVEAGYSRAALEQVVFSIHHLGPIFDCPDPTVTVVYKAWWKDLCRTQLSMDQHQANPITLSVRDALLAAIDDALSRAPSALLHRDAALIAVMYDGLLRASEVAALRWDDLAQTKKGAGTLTIRRSKIDQEGIGAVVYLTRETTERIERWRACCFTRCDWMFHAAPRDSDHANDAPPGRLSPCTIKQILDRATALARLEGAHLTGHSARVGAAQDMVACGMSMPSIMQVGRWKDPTMVARYTRNLDAVAVGEDRFSRLARLTPQP